MSNAPETDRAATLAALQALLEQSDFVAGEPVHLANDRVRIWIDSDPDTEEHVLTFLQELPTFQPLNGVKVSSFAAGGDASKPLGETNHVGQLDVAVWVPGCTYRLAVAEGRARSIDLFSRILDDAWQVATPDAVREPGRLTREPGRLTREIANQCGLPWSEASPPLHLAAQSDASGGLGLPKRLDSVEEWRDWVNIDLPADAATFGVARLIAQSAADHRPLGRVLVTLRPLMLPDGSQRLRGRVRWEQLLGRPIDDRRELGKLEYCLVPARDDTLKLFSVRDVEELLSSEDVASQTDLRQDVERLWQALLRPSEALTADEEP